ncbi:Ceramide glucosyltransferase [Schistosoma japonicum]|uniref:ceramide glucosyltransferase n=1 Tax=Schistosoma japonicum TaxID=6182 RepID=A0A4Z2DCE5_SCHJA|nr:Ceramide glucosyltransferase [Schistosoma japonicum]
MDPFHFVNEFHRLNLTTRPPNYGYIYYAGLYSSNSFILEILISLLCIGGITSNCLLIASHICAILYGRRHLYQVPYPMNLQRVYKCPLYRRCMRQLYSILCKCPSSYIVPLTTSCLRCLFCFKCRKNVNLMVSTKHSKTTITETTTATANSITTCQNTMSTNSHSGNLPINNNVMIHMKCEVQWPGVSILKPLSGRDPNLETNLLSFFQMNYPTFELLFCISDREDPAYELVERLITQHPHVDAKIILAKDFFGINPKVNNLQAGYEVSKYSRLLISDSGLWMRSEGLMDMVSSLEMDPKVGLIHQVPYIKPYNGIVSYKRDKDGFSIQDYFKNIDYNDDYEKALRSSTLTNSEYISTTCEQPSFTWVVQLVFFSCWHAKVYLVSAFLDINCVTGMSCLLRKSILNDSGGFKQFGCYLAEDYFITKYICSRGWKVCLSHQPAWQNSPSPCLYQFYLRILRWSQLRLSMAFFTFLIEPLSRCLPNALLGAFSLAYLFPNFIDPGVYFLCYILIWFLLDYILLRQIYPPSTPICITKLEYLVAWLFSELLAFPLHLTAACFREVQWRDKRFRLRWGGISERIDQHNVI